MAGVATTGEYISEAGIYRAKVGRWTRPGAPPGRARDHFPTRFRRRASSMRRYGAHLESIALTSNPDSEGAAGEPVSDPDDARSPEDDSLDRVLRQKRHVAPGPTASSAVPDRPEVGSEPAAVESERIQSADPPTELMSSARGPTADLLPGRGPPTSGPTIAPEIWPDSLPGNRPQPTLSGWDNFCLSPAYRLGGAAIWVLAIFILWRVGSAFLDGEFMTRVLALDAPFLPVPAPDSIVVAEVSLKSAAFVGAPLVLAVLWFAGAYQIDRTARRTFGFDESLDSQYPAGYVITAILSVFPLLVFGVIGAAWGGVALTTWAIGHEGWGSVLALLALLAAFSISLWILDKGFERREHSGRPRPR